MSPSHRAHPGPCGTVYWFRNDLRLHDHPALACAIERTQAKGGWLLPVWVDDPAQHATTRWGFSRMGTQRSRWWRMAVDSLQTALRARDSGLLVLAGDPATVLLHLVQGLALQGAAVDMVCEDIPAPEEQAAVASLRAHGVTVHTVWQSTLLALEDLPFHPDRVPDTFTTFRQAVERSTVVARRPLATPSTLPPLPAHGAWALPNPRLPEGPARAAAEPLDDPRSSFPLHRPECHGSEAAALAHLQRYCALGLPRTYKATRNGLTGLGHSSKWSPWLATGALSPRQAWAAVQAFEAEHGASDGTYWLWFELLWRDHFRLLHRKHGKRLYRASGLGSLPKPPHDPEAFRRWCQGRTGQSFIDAGMRELAATGYLSNRMRQNVASWLVHDLGCDWRAGAAWFESQLLDFDVHSNQGNWLYIAGRGTDPRGGRRFNPDKQAQDHDPDGAYRRLWGAAS